MEGPEFRKAYEDMMCKECNSYIDTIDWDMMLLPEGVSRLGFKIDGRTMHISCYFGKKYTDNNLSKYLRHVSGWGG